MNKIVKNFWTGAVSLIPPEKQPSARQDVAEKRLTPDLIEAAAQVIICETKPAESEDAGKVKTENAIGALVESVVRLEKKFDEIKSGQAARAVSPDGLGEKVQGVRNDLRKIEDKLDTLVPYQLWKVAVVAGVAFVIGAVLSWNIRPAYKQWERDQQEQQEGR